MTRRTKPDAAPDETSQHLDALVEKAKTTRLNTGEERNATELLRKKITDGKAGLASAVPTALALPWLVGVTAFSEEWQGLSATARRSVVTALEKADATDGCRRFRLSLARGIIAHDPAIAEKLITNVASAMIENDDPPAKDRQTFANVMLGKSRPWISRAPVQEWKGAKKIAAMTAFAAAGSPPFAQPGIVRWLHETGLLSKLTAPALASLAGEMRRWKNQQRKELGLAAEQLPAELADALAAAPQPQQPQKPAPKQPVDKTESEQPKEAAQQPQQQKAAKPALKQEPKRLPQHEAQPVPPRQEQKHPAAQTDVPRMLRQIEQEFARLRHELIQSRAQSSQRGRQPRHEPAATPVDTEELETLRRCNAQLEERITDLRNQLEDLATHHEDHATTRLAGTEAEQFRSLLSLKLQEDYEMFVGLRNDTATEVIRRTLVDVLGHIFEVLRGEGVPFNDPAPAS